MKPNNPIAAGITIGRRREDEEDLSSDSTESDETESTDYGTSEPDSEYSDGLEGSEEYTNFRGDGSLNPADSASGGTTGGTGDADDRKEDEEDGVSGNYSSSRGDAFGEGNEVSERSDQTLDADLLARNEEFAFNQNLSLLKKYYYATTEKKVLELSQRLQEMYPNKVEKIQVTLNEAKKIWDTPNPLVLSPEEWRKRRIEQLENPSEDLMKEWFGSKEPSLNALFDETKGHGVILPFKSDVHLGKIEVKPSEDINNLVKVYNSKFNSNFTVDQILQLNNVTKDNLLKNGGNLNVPDPSINTASTPWKKYDGEITFQSVDQLKKEINSFNKEYGTKYSYEDVVMYNMGPNAKGYDLKTGEGTGTLSV
ncbi:MAG: hypothetical protein KDK54_20445 [Leptospiraceae bacterium]|nr:hypothetical protein [Leptospiraceae bacterium]